MFCIREWRTKKLLRFLGKCALIFCITCTSATLAAQTSTEKTHWRHIAKTLWGKPDGTNLYLGMWTAHFNDKSRQKDNAQNWTLAITHKGFYVGTFKNSYYNWTFNFGIQRLVVDKQLNANTNLKLGYRIGGIYGYDERLCSYCGKLKVLPIFIPYGDIQYKRVGVEFQYVYILATVGFYIKLA